MGMPLAEAMALANAHFEQHDPGADRAALLQLAAWCEQFSPIVGIEPPDDLALDITGLGPLFGGEQSLAQQVLRAIQQQGAAGQLGIADTIGAAWAIAHCRKEFPIVVPPGETAAALADLPVAALRLQEQTDILKELGIERIGQLLALPRDLIGSYCCDSIKPLAWYPSRLRRTAHRPKLSPKPN